MILHGQFLFGIFVSMVTIAIQAVATIGVMRVARWVGRRLTRHHRVRALIYVMAATGALLTLTHLVQVGVWAIAYALVGETEAGDAYYFAFVNFTTIGGSIEPDRYWRLLGPMAAANGMLLFGWSTAVMFAVLSKATQILKIR